jgi:hypothetical protein
MPLEQHRVDLEMFKDVQEELPALNCEDQAAQAS